MKSIREMEINLLQTEHLQHRVFNTFASGEARLREIQITGVQNEADEHLVMGCLAYVLGMINLESARNLLEEMKILDDNE
jgi:primosomal replication protein N